MGAHRAGRGVYTSTQNGNYASSQLPNTGAAPTIL
jgi:hypothetical protein